MWVAAEEAASVTPDDLHSDPEEAESHEELWCFDHELLPITGECSPDEAAAAGIMLSYVPDDELSAFMAWFANENHAITADEEPYNAFVDAFDGEWEDFESFAQHIVEETGMLDGVPESITKYFDIESFARDLRFDYSVLDAPGGGVYIFRTC